jgi:hypothetical protein
MMKSGAHVQRGQAVELLGVAVLMAPVPMPPSVLLATMSSHCPSRPRVVGGVVHGGHCAVGGQPTGDRPANASRAANPQRQLRGGDDDQR